MKTQFFYFFWYDLNEIVPKNRLLKAKKKNGKILFQVLIRTYNKNIHPTESFIKRALFALGRFLVFRFILPHTPCVDYNLLHANSLVKRDNVTSRDCIRIHRVCVCVTK